MATPRPDLKDARVAAGLTQTQLGDKIGKTQTVISRYETGEYAIDIQTAPLIANALKIGVLEVLYAPPAPKRKAA